MLLNYAFKFQCLLYFYMLFYEYVVSNLIELKIDALDITRNNYITWAVDVEIHLRENEF